MCEDNSCIMWVITVFKDSLPRYIDKNCPRKWRKDVSDLYDWIDPEIVNEILNDLGEESISHTIICEFKFDWTEDPRKNLSDQIYGMNISGWLTKNHNNKYLVYAEAWNKID